MAPIQPQGHKDSHFLIFISLLSFSIFIFLSIVCQPVCANSLMVALDRQLQVSVFGNGGIDRPAANCANRHALMVSLYGRLFKVVGEWLLVVPCLTPQNVDNDALY